MGAVSSGHAFDEGKRTATAAARSTERPAKSIVPPAAVAETDESLVRRFVETSDRDAFQELATRHIVGMRRLLFGLFRGHHEDMEDAEQEILLALYRSLPGFRFESKFRTYLYRFTRNKAIDILRKKGRERTVLERWKLSQMPLSEDHPEELVLRRVEVGQAMALLLELKEEERSMVLMREVDGLSLKEIAQAMGLRLGTVKSRLHRVRGKIEQLVADREAAEREARNG